MVSLERDTGATTRLRQNIQTLQHSSRLIADESLFHALLCAFIRVSGHLYIYATSMLPQLVHARATIAGSADLANGAMVNRSAPHLFATKPTGIPHLQTTGQYQSLIDCILANTSRSLHPHSKMNTVSGGQETTKKYTTVG